MAIHGIFFFSSFQTGYHSLAKTGLEINVWPTLASSWQPSSCPTFPSAGIMGGNKLPRPADGHLAADLLNLCECRSLVTLTSEPHP